MKRNAAQASAKGSGMSEDEQACVALHSQRQHRGGAEPALCADTAAAADAGRRSLPTRTATPSRATAAAILHSWPASSAIALLGLIVPLLSPKADLYCVWRV